MIVYLCVTLLSLAGAWWVRGASLLPRTGSPSISESRRHFPRTRADVMSMIALAFIFFVLFIPEAIRVNVGNDYLKYADFMHLIVSDAYVPTEIGFNSLVYFIYSLCGFENYLLVFALFAAMTIALFLLAIRQQADDFFFSFFLFMMLGYYFQTYNTVRYYFALSIVLFSLRFFLQKEYIPWLLLVLLAATFHKSVLVVLVLYPLALLPWKKWMLALGALFCISFVFFESFWLKVVVTLYPSYENTEYLEGSGFNPVNILRCAAVIILAGIVLILLGNSGGDGKRKKDGILAGIKEIELAGGTKEKLRFRFYLHATVLAFLLYVFCSFLPIISRIGYYLTTPQIFFIPQLLLMLPKKGKRIKNPRKLFTILVVLAAVFYFLLFIRKLGSVELKILPYRTFFFSDMPAIESNVRD